MSRNKFCGKGAKCQKVCRPSLLIFFILFSLNPIPRLGSSKTRQTWNQRKYVTKLESQNKFFPKGLTRSLLLLLPLRPPPSPPLLLRPQLAMSFYCGITTSNGRTTRGNLYRVCRTRWSCVYFWTYGRVLKLSCPTFHEKTVTYTESQKMLEMSWVIFRPVWTKIWFLRHRRWRCESKAGSSLFTGRKVYRKAASHV